MVPSVCTAAVITELSAAVINAPQSYVDRLYDNNVTVYRTDRDTAEDSPKSNYLSSSWSLNYVYSNFTIKGFFKSLGIENYPDNHVLIFNRCVLQGFEDFTRLCCAEPAV